MAIFAASQRANCLKIHEGRKLEGVSRAETLQLKPLAVSWEVRKYLILNNLQFFKNGQSRVLSDLADYQEASSPKPPYYMGTVLVHRHAGKRKRFIIDGQQRLTALCILHRQLADGLPAHCALTYSPESARRIRSADGIFKDHLRKLELDDTIFGQIVFTVIYVNRVDLAFTFFDTQNNQGVPLHSTLAIFAASQRANCLKIHEGRKLEGVSRAETLKPKPLAVSCGTRKPLI